MTDYLITHQWQALGLIVITFTALGWAVKQLIDEIHDNL